MAGTMIVGYDGTQGARAALGRAIELGRVPVLVVPTGPED